MVGIDYFLKKFRNQRKCDMIIVCEIKNFDVSFCF